MRAAMGVVAVYGGLLAIYGLLYGMNLLVPLEILALSVISYAVYGWDKRKARHNGWRVPEKTLHLLGLMGGWPGALIGQWHFRHKNRKPAFQVVFWLTVVLNVVVVFMWCLPEWSGWK